MIKYLPRLTEIVLEEIPGKVTLAVEISNCQGSCIGCHSPFLRTNIGDELNFAVVKSLIDSNFGVNCFLFLGEGNDLEALLNLAREIRQSYHHLELAIYSGRTEVEDEFYEIFDYVKVGPYIEEFGPLNSPTTNQRLYYKKQDITSRFWRKQ
ncbi:MAG: anaerobic ribonucleoside-triphosphate reductase activating protein [Bacteroidales bacterium]|nr:anaerobic ribonucleoside-triphosphate reductase activating protein [Bacteroidales bacterium]